MSDLTEFLLARIAEDEAVEYEYTDIRDGHEKPLRVRVDAVPPSVRALAEARAKRAIVGEHTAHPSDEPWCESDEQAWPCVTVRTLAAVYADHADYRKEWAW